MALAAMSPNFKVPKRLPVHCFLNLLLSWHQLTALAKIRVVPPTPWDAFFLPPAGLVWPNKASLMVLLKGEWVGTLWGLFLAACHDEILQLAKENKDNSQEPRLLWFCPGNISGTVLDWGPARLCRLPYVHHWFSS